MEQGREQSEFNSAISYLNRLNGLFYQADDASMNLDSYTWFHSLLAIYRELSTELKDEELKSFEKDKDFLAGLINQSISMQQRGRLRGFPQELYDALHKFELRLRKVMKDSGLQMRMKEDGRNALR